ncbi:MAG: alpha/beta hydrolase fold domain-containing protein [Actinomycetales bacterium]
MPTTHTFAGHDGLDLQLDVYSPTAVGPHPGVILMHGGGWRVGNRGEFGSLATSRPRFFADLADAGLVAISVDYRLSTQATWPAQLEDVRLAARWVAEHAGALGVDPSRIGLWGESAGGHLASMLALAGQFPGEPRLDVRAVVAWYAPANLATMGAQRRPDALANADDEDSREAQLLGRAVQDDLALTSAASPVRHVGPEAPAFLLVHGDHDRLVPVGQSTELAAELTGAGNPDVTVEVVPGADHLWRGVADPGAIVDRSRDWLLARLS